MTMSGSTIINIMNTTVANEMTTYPYPCNGSNSTTVMSSMSADYLLIKKTMTPIIYAFGFPGNIMAFLIWIRPKMRHSSGVYLAALALADLLFLFLHLLYELDMTWMVRTINYPVICEGYTIIFLTFQCLAPLLVLAFTVERYISICHPFKRDIYCTQRRAQMVSLSLAGGSLVICAIQGYFWTYDDETGCGIRKEALLGDNSSLWNIWSWVTDLIFFLVVPMCVLTFNILVIREAQRLSKYEQTQLHGRSQKTSATTIMLLAVSFYLIITTLPATVVYVTVLNFKEGPLCVAQDDNPVWIRYWSYILVRAVVEEIGITHFALNFYIYLLTGKQFRQEFKHMFMGWLGHSIPEKVRTEYSTLRTSFRSSIKKNVTVRLSANGTTTNSDKEINGGETKL